MQMINPWENISFGSQRRIESKSRFNYFWITDTSRHYGLFIQTGYDLPPTLNTLRLKGITLRNQNTDGKGELFLIINSNTEWELFLKICMDLIRSSETAAGEEQMINAVYSRLKKWQSFLKQGASTSLSLIEQMGLYTELDCLLNHILPSNGAEQTVTSWTGADFDKQDFSLSEKLVEVKSYASSKGASVYISSMHQLDNSKKMLYLLVYGLTVTSSGFSLTDLVTQIENNLALNQDALEQFQEKMAMRGYIPGATDPPFHKFQIDRQIAFQVRDDFPKILSTDVPAEVSSVNYILDILKCMNFNVELNSVFE